MSTANLRGRHRRSGFSGTVWSAGQMLGEVVSIEWSTELEQIAVPIPGRFQDDTKPGRETRRGTFQIHDVHDRWALMVWDFIDARRRGDRNAAAAVPEFEIVTKLDEIGSPGITSWSLEGCQLYQLEGGFAQADDLLTRDIPFSFLSERPLEAFTYNDKGQVVFRSNT